MQKSPAIKVTRKYETQNQIFQPLIKKKNNKSRIFPGTFSGKTIVFADEAAVHCDVLVAKNTFADDGDT